MANSPQLKVGPEEAFSGSTWAERDPAALAPGASVPGLGEGWVGEEALAIGVHAALVTDGFEDAVRLASNHDGDSDSTASIAGQLVGAWRGAGVVPEGWAEGLDCGVELTKLARQYGV